MDGGSGTRTGTGSQPGLSNSTESIDSMKALTAAIEAANAQVLLPPDAHLLLPVHRVVLLHSKFPMLGSHSLLL